MKQKDLVTLLALTLVVVVAWVGLNFYNNYTQSTISETQNLQITPIDPTFDMETITTLKSRQRITPIYEIGQDNITQTTQSAPTQNATPSDETPTSPAPTQAPDTETTPQDEAPPIDEPTPASEE